MEVLEDFEVGRINRAFSRDEQSLNVSEYSAELRLNTDVANLNLYYKIFLKDNSQLNKLVSQLNQLISIEIAYIPAIVTDAFFYTRRENFLL